jgi:hypothetical protein
MIGITGSVLRVDMALKSAWVLFNVFNNYKKLQFSTACLPEHECLKIYSF